MKDYYRILGVLDDAEDFIIRATYKALAQRYHPDKWKGDPQEANKRMSDINEAYDVLSDAEKRKIYDEEYFANHPKNQAEESEEDEFDDSKNDDPEGWSIAVSFFPEIHNYFEELKKISPQVGNTFRSHLIATQDFKKAQVIKNQLESDYFERYYGSDRQIQRYAKGLLLGKHYKAAIQVNKIICVLGNSVNYQDIKEKIETDFPEVSTQHNSVNVGKERDDLITSIKNEYLSPVELSDLYKKLYGSNLEIKNSLFTTNYIAVIGGVRVKLDSGDLKRKLLAKI